MKKRSLVTIFICPCFGQFAIAKDTDLLWKGDNMARGLSLLKSVVGEAELIEAVSGDGVTDTLKVHIEEFVNYSWRYKPNQFDVFVEDRMTEIAENEI